MFGTMATLEQHAEWRGIGINFPKTSGQRRADKDMLREEEIIKRLIVDTISARIIPLSETQSNVLYIWMH